LTKLDNDAKDKKKGIYGKKEDATENYELKDLTNSRDNTEENQTMFSLMKDRKTTGVVEKVLTGSRLKISLPKHNSLIVLSLSGISTNVGNKEDKEKPFFEESTTFSIKKLANRDIEVLIDRDMIVLISEKGVDAYSPEMV